MIIPGRSERAPVIHGRMVDAIESRKMKMPDGKNPHYLFLGRDEWDQFCELCKTWEVEGFPKGGAAHDPANIEAHRTKFRDVPIYRVDAKSFLSAL